MKLLEGSKSRGYYITEKDYRDTNKYREYSCR